MRAGVLVLVVMAVALPPDANARTMEERLQAVCRDEIRTLCPDRSPDDARTCMIMNRAQVSAACIRLIDAAE
jgi:hypothetical protein